MVETAYPFTLQNADSMGNLLGDDSLIPAYPATPEGQHRYMVDLTQLTVDAGGIGVVYWEPIGYRRSAERRSAKAQAGRTRPGSTSKQHEALPVFEWLHHKYRRPPAPKGERG